MEPAGLATGGLGIALAFKGAIDTSLFIKSFFDEDNLSCGTLALRYHIEKTRLNTWGNYCKAGDALNCIFRDRPRVIKDDITRILGEIQKYDEQADDMVKKYDIKLPELPNNVSDEGIRFGSPMTIALAKRSMKTRPNSRFRWTITARPSFENIVVQIHGLITELETLTLQPWETRLLANALTPFALAPLDRRDLLEILGTSGSQIQRTIALSAEAKLLQPRISPDITSVPPSIPFNQLEFPGSSPNIGTLICSDGQRRVVWVEWIILDPASDYSKHIKRILSLGSVLKQVSEPAMRLPSFYGMFDDLRYEANYQRKKLGYVFAPPNEGSIYDNVQRYEYEANLLDHPPISLSELIKNQKPQDQGCKPVPIPSLGDRFQLAYTLACAFGRFHAAGWLHKGFHAGSILFFERINDQGILLTEPFITGFQYSRPQGQNSLSYSPLMDNKLEYYYLPESMNGFTKRLDLYSLGVVLCEIGRWDLLGRKRGKITSQEKWREFITGDVLKDLSWRMGTKYQGAVRVLLNCELPGDELGDQVFAQEFLKKVMLPLSSCSA
ncbi:hypothetical protein F5Y04DRAFT_79688 [Hypomontagnella monticulosa]|nr:hypothetical protein F5Y04DRAFT_79688 [Hypomontagnella monticulosa]